LGKWGLSETQYEWLGRVLKTYLPEAKIKVFGSRARGDQKRYSDLDLAIESQSLVPPDTLRQLNEQFAQSDIPFKIDLVELNQIDSSFLQAITEDLKQF
jgi:uncharacterized protein